MFQNLEPSVNKGMSFYVVSGAGVYNRKLGFEKNEINVDFHTRGFILNRSLSKRIICVLLLAKETRGELGGQSWYYSRK